MDEESEARKPKRQKTSYKAKAFEKFKQLKSGGRKKYEIEEVDNLYEVVDEREYAKKVLDRQDDDWIVDDDGSGYVEDGRDIFDDDLDAESINQAKSKNKGVKRKKAVSDNASKGNLKYMLSNITSKKKEETQMQDDNMLSEILGEIDASPSTIKKDVKPFVPKRQLAQNYLKKFSIDNKLKVEKPPIETVKDEEIVKTPSSIDEDSEKEEVLNSKQETKIISLKKEDSKSDQIEDSQEVDDAFTDDLDLLQMEAIETKITESESQETYSEPKNDSFDLAAMFTQSSGFNSSLEEEEICTPTVSDDEAFRFFWWDAFEDAEKQKGKVFLFGKTYCRQSKSYVSCCVAVENLSYQIFLLPRPFMLDDSGKPTDKPVTYQDLYKEFSSLIADKMKIQSFKARLCQKKYAFDPTVPIESDYMEVKYAATGPRIFPDAIKENPKTFSKIFGAFSSNLERFLLEAKLKGPCWLDIKNPKFNNHPLSWCKLELKCHIGDLVKVVENIPPPPLTVATINFRHHINSGSNQQEILMVSCVTQTSYAVDKKAPRQVFDQHFCVFTGPAKQPLPMNIHAQLQKYKGTRVQKMDSEKALLNYFILQFAKIDPDLVVGHDLVGFQMDILANRLTKRDVSSFSKLSRIKRTEKYRLMKDLFVGRLVADLKISAKELIKSRTYDLPTLCQQVLKLREDQITDLEPDEIVKMYENTEDIFKLIEYTMQDTAYMLKILYDLNIIPLALQITNIAGNIMSRTLMGGRSERNEYLLLHAFQEKDYIVPEKKFKSKSNNSEAAKKKPTYAGGLVLEPKIGFYDKLLLLMDFNSLYPSIIQEYNICFTTLPTIDEDNNLVLPDKHLPPGILPVEIKKLVDSRKQVKKLMTTPDLSPDMWMQYNIRQMALKLTANSMYGCLGFANSRFYAKNLAALVTQKGREILMNTRDLVEKMLFEVVYGDTDSIMINTNMLDYDQVLKIGTKIKQEVNKYYKMVELDIDGIFKYLLLLKKKKYAAVTLKRTSDGQLKEEKEYKGLDIVRRDWSGISSEAGKQVLEYILSDQTEDERLINIQNYLRKLREELEQGGVPIQLLEITRQLTKEPKSYTNKDALPHVQVALRYNQEHRGHLRAGDAVSYVICEDGTNNSATKRGYHPEELKTKEHLKIDNNYYLAQQIHPVVARLIDPIEGIDAEVIAECLGLDGTAFKKTASKNTKDVSENITSPEVKYRNCVKFTFKCLMCQEENTVNGPLNLNQDKVPFLAKCSNPDCTAHPIDYLYHIQNQLTFQMSDFVKKYYDNKLTCEDPGCPNDTNKLPMKFASKYPVCQGCQQCVLYREYTEAELDTQLEYFVYIFQLNPVIKPLLEDSIERGYQQLLETVTNYKKRSAYSVVKLKDIFEVLMNEKYI